MPQIQSILRKTILPLVGLSAPPGTEPLPDLASFDRVLLSFVNWRLGNNVLITPAVHALTSAYPNVAFDFLGGPSCVPILQGFPLARVHVVTRGQVVDPVRLAWFVRGLRRRGYPAAIHVHPGTATLGAFFTGMSRAPVRIGSLRESGNLYFTTTVPRPTTVHKVDRMNEYLGHLGLPSDNRRSIRLSHEEREEAEAQLHSEGAGAPTQRVTLFLGGRARKGKSWPLSFFRGVVAGLEARGLRPIAILGPEELRRERKIREALPGCVVLSRQPIRRVAALVACSRLAIAPDSGPMHLAIATRTPTIGLFRTPTGQQWGPRPGQGAVVFDPSGADVEAVLAAVDGAETAG